VEMLSEKIVLFRNNEGKVVAINDVCTHRGAPLHKGAPPVTPSRSCVCSHPDDCGADLVPRSMAAPGHRWIVPA
jgi:Rieske [2Fe-2S] domain